jgi:glyoxylase-like metal-dependent hydrolase (beta-lactamase superfamily II)
MEGTGAVFVGDVALSRVHAYLADGHSGPWLRSLARLRGELGVGAMLYPGHGEPSTTRLLEWQATYITAYREAVRDLAGGRPSLTDAARRELEARMSTVLSNDRLARFISLGADAVAAELAAGG